MSRTYKATGINLKSMPMGEADRLLTILTREHGLVKAIAMGSRKHNSSLSGRSGLFVVNHLLIAKGRSLDKVTQAETLESYPGLAQDLKKLTASQYIAELCLCQALSEQPQEELFCLLNLHLSRLERSPADLILPCLTHAIFELLVLEGVAPEVYRCCTSQTSILPNFQTPGWRVGFSPTAGGTVTLEVLQQLQQRPMPRSTSAQGRRQQLHRTMSAIELAILQAISGNRSILQAEEENPPTLGAAELPASNQDWLAVERLLRHYAEYHFDRTIRSAALVDACFLSSPSSLEPSKL